MRRSLSASQSRWRAAVARLTNPERRVVGVARHVLDLLAGVLADESAANSSRLNTVSTFSSVNPGRASVSTPPAGRLDRRHRLPEHAPWSRRRPGSGSRRARRRSGARPSVVARGGGSSSRHAGAFHRSGPASTSSSSSRSPIDRAIGPVTARSASASVPGMPGICPWPGTIAEARLVAHHPAVVGGDADRAADVGAELDRREAHRERRRRTARRPAARCGRGRAGCWWCRTRR